ncbi:hypothetical protein B4U80_09823 [Leptotrombidium deliense]|uniref:Uncharacterized protein n=1 Tax=Leptotrombidium deliense TaxID=299467 RepID=A0A443S1J5_9ACAR|nr:hypothetical protein B4U80_09823 [Leptotrombidium deliense]
MAEMDGYSGDGYMEQEEEWEREGLLDPAWEKQQRKRQSDMQICVECLVAIDVTSRIV